MQYLTKSFHSKVNTDTSGSKSNIDANDCVKKLNKWLAKSNQQDVKVDDFSFTVDWLNIADYRTNLVIIYHHVKFNYPPNV